MLLSRRAFLRGSVAAVVGGGAGVYVYGRTIERHWLDIVPVQTSLGRLPDAFAGFTIAQISDLHFGPFVQAAHMEPVIQAVLGLRPDMIVVTGDIVSGVRHGEPDMIQAMSRLQAPHGVFAILGNHDWWEDAPLVAQCLERAGITVLRNQSLPIRPGGPPLYLAGVDDVWCAKNDLAETMRGIPADAPVIALVHEPDYADTLANDARVILQLSGHTHGGQVRVPFYGGIRFPTLGRKYPDGLYHIRDLTLYTNRGIGVVNQPIRIACRPEITLFTLNPA